MQRYRTPSLQALMRMLDSLVRSLLGASRSRLGGCGSARRAVRRKPPELLETTAGREPAHGSSGWATSGAWLGLVPEVQARRAQPLLLLLHSHLLATSLKHHRVDLELRRLLRHCQAAASTVAGRNFATGWARSGAGACGGAARPRANGSTRQSLLHGINSWTRRHGNHIGGVRMAVGFGLARCQFFSVTDCDLEDFLLLHRSWNGITRPIRPSICCSKHLL